VPFLTPNSLAGTKVLILSVPADVLLRAAVIGSLTPLVFPESWEAYGTQSANDTAAAMADIIDQLAWVDSVPTGGFPVQYAHVKRTTNLTLSGYTKVAYDSVISDADGLYDTGNNYFVASGDGVYLLYASLQLNAYTRGVSMFAKINGTDNHGMSAGDGDNVFAAASVTIPLSLADGDTIEVYCYASGAASITATGTPPIEARLVRLS